MNTRELKIDPKWRTDQTRQICLTVRETGDYGGLPILADAIQEAGCENTELLDRLRAAPQNEIEDQKLTAMLWSEEGEEAVRWIEDLAENILGDSHGYRDYDYDGVVPGSEITQPMNYEVIMKAAASWEEGEERGRSGDGWGGNYVTQVGSENWRDHFPSYAEGFWKRFALITGITPYDPGASFFSCSC